MKYRCEFKDNCEYSKNGKYCQYVTRKDVTQRCPQWTKFKYQKYLDDRLRESERRLI